MAINPGGKPYGLIKMDNNVLAVKNKNSYSHKRLLRNSFRDGQGFAKAFTDTAGRNGTIWERLRPTSPQFPWRQ